MHRSLEIIRVNINNSVLGMITHKCLRGNPEAKYKEKIK